MQPYTKPVKVKLENGVIAYIEAVPVGSREQDVAGDLERVLPFAEVAGTIEGIASTVMIPLKKVKPKKATVELGLTVGIESGQLTALIVKGTGEANLKITLEWESDDLKDQGAKSEN